MKIIVNKYEFAELIRKCNDSYCGHCALKNFCMPSNMNDKEKNIESICEIVGDNISFPYNPCGPIIRPNRENEQNDFYYKNKRCYDDGITCIADNKKNMDNKNCTVDNKMDNKNDNKNGNKTINGV